MGHNAKVAKVPFLARAASMALSFDAGAREVRVAAFLKHHGGVAVQHKADLLHLPGSNISKWEALAVPASAT